MKPNEKQLSCAVSEDGMPIAAGSVADESIPLSNEAAIRFLAAAIDDDGMSISAGWRSKSDSHERSVIPAVMGNERLATQTTRDS